jgi:hypothetical protein
MQLGDLVTYREGTQTLTGKIKTILGRKWISIQWSDKLVSDEHVDDLNILQKTS